MSVPLPPQPHPFRSDIATWPFVDASPLPFQPHGGGGGGGGDSRPATGQLWPRRA